jgi:hypothetical protein
LVIRNTPGFGFGTYLWGFKVRIEANRIILYHTKSSQRPSL